MPKRAAASSLDVSRVVGAPSIGRVIAGSASLWFLAIDPAHASAWKGDEGFDYDDDGTSAKISKLNAKTDFGRAMATNKLGASIDVGAHRGIICRIGGCGASEIWRIDHGIAFLCFFAADDGDEDIAALGKRVVGLPTYGKSKLVGQIDVRSGCLALVIPYAKGTFTKAQISSAAKAKAKKAKNVSEDRVLVPLANGTYDVFSEAVGTSKDYEDELGSYERRVRIVKV